MSTYLGNQLLSGVATNTISNAHSLLDFKWSDHILNEMSWLRADTFSWQSGDVYVAAYNHLVADNSSGTSQTETIGSYTITYVLATDGHKITTDETNVVNIYNESGIAWYYILDTTNKRFKLPRTKFGFTGLRDGAGNFVSAGLPNIVGELNNACLDRVAASGAFSRNSKDSGSGYGGSSFTDTGVDFNASRSSAIYGNSNTVQPPATQMYLYFYVGQFSQSATEQTAGLNTELFNGKQDVLPNTVDYVVESYRNGANWYRIYKSGWVEQGGQTTTGGTTNLLKNFSHTDYTVEISLLEMSAYPYGWRVYDRTVSNFKSAGDNGSNGKQSMWVAFGQGE